MSSDGILELEPMNSYNRLLFRYCFIAKKGLSSCLRFSHHSIGGDDLHLVLECCPETSIPSIVISDSSSSMMNWNLQRY